MTTNFNCKRCKKNNELEPKDFKHIPNSNRDTRYDWKCKNENCGGNNNAFDKKPGSSGNYEQVLDYDFIQEINKYHQENKPKTPGV